MQQTPRLNVALVGVSLLSSLLAIAFVLLAHTGSRGIYTHALLGGLYELLWLPLLATLVGIPFLSLVLVLKKKMAWPHLIVPTLLAVGTFLFLILFN